MREQGDIELATRARGFTEITQAVEEIVAARGIADGLCSVFIRHTSASLIVCENADPAVLVDLERYMSGIVIDGDARFTHDAEGPDDMPAHIRSVLTQTEISIPVRSGRLALGTWQGIFVWEHRYRAHQRTISVTVIGT